MRLFDADDIIARMPDNLPYKASVRRVLMQAKEVDAMPVVRCKECKHCLLDLSGRESHLCMRNNLRLPIRLRIKTNDFCSYGERTVIE